ncbi:SoxR reducing system RseC family protein [Pasteurella atlantica]|uniref:SoxR reducing system RseC family protein n=1 Tax=Pasteurellaceae TaxID=712 RepID=UPI00274E0F10|nr:SoxR reducing system RseC family protein [Pasteurella atlantica]MDP8098284.1 SoxR reducing system RseC family protein [Pasteurella atlantica]MDP8106562.1 SoxR reducing system RseC family protein [Pasteurella atlantica]MDP8116087.1 SoxR reducing system RseC family protein [Pasteurella atlantica]
MLIEQGKVLSYHNGIAKVECYTKSGCGSCDAKQGCGTQSLSELTGSKVVSLLDLEVFEELKQGDIINIGLNESSLLVSVMWLYCIPLTVLIVSAVGFSQLFANELIVALLTITATLLSFGGIKWKLSQKKHFNPQIIFLGKVN